MLKFFFISFRFIKVIVVNCCSSINILFYIFLICYKRHLSVICRKYIIYQLFIQFVIKSSHINNIVGLLFGFQNMQWFFDNVCGVIEAIKPFLHHRTWNDNSWFKMQIISIVYKKMISVIHILLKMFYQFEDMRL